MLTMLDSQQRSHENTGYVSAWLAAHDDHEETTDSESVGSDSGRWTGSDGDHGRTQHGHDSHTQELHR